MDKKPQERSTDTTIRLSLANLAKLNELRAPERLTQDQFIGRLLDEKMKEKNQRR